MSPSSSNGLDGSWQMAVHLWGHSLPGLGPRIDFTYGPLGFLTLPALWWGTTGVLAWLAALVTTLACAWVAVARLRRWLPLLAALAAALVVVRGLLLVDGVFAAWPLFAWWWVADAEPKRPRDRLVATVVLAALADVLLMCKFGDGTILAGVALGAPLLWDRRPWRELAAGAGTLVIGSFALWSVLTLAPGQFVHYLKTSLGLAGGYWAMTLPKASGIGYVIVALLMGAALLVLTATAGPRRRALWLAVITAWLLWLELKHAFVRADRVHVPAFFVTAMVVALAAALGSHRYRLLSRGAIGVTAVVLMLVTAGSVRHSWRIPWSGPHRFQAQLSEITTASAQRTVQNEARTELQERYGVSPSVLEPIGRGTVQIDPIDAVVAWAYGLRLQPVPVLQLYSAYTTALDRENVRAIEGNRAPQYVLRHLTAGAVNGRVVDWESPGYQVSVVCHYRDVLTDGEWQLLERAPASMCGSRQRIKTVSLRRRVTVPVAKPGELIVATFDIRATHVERLERLLFRETPPSVEIGTTRYPFVTGAAGAPHLMSVPPGAPIGPGGAAPVQVRALRMLGSAAHGTVTFWSMPFRPAASPPGAGTPRRPALG